MAQIATTLEQSKNLVKLGLNPETGDMHYYIYDFTDGYPEISSYKEQKEWINKYRVNPDKALEEYYPAWSIGELLELMPEIDNQLPSLRKCNDYYCVVYSDVITRIGDAQWQNGNSPIEAVYNMMVYLLENYYIQTEK